MKGSIRLGFGIAVLFAAGVFAVSVFGKHDDWFLRAARANAVRCLTKMPCPRIEAEGVVPNAPPPLSAASVCAKPENWNNAAGEAGRTPVFAVTCRDGGTTYLYHLGRFDGAGEEQWMACAGSNCAGEVARLTKP